jgi:phosphatidylserine/phosphatidylglycerophosphate/cardiolipin synthase-like enzyme
VCAPTRPPPRPVPAPPSTPTSTASPVPTTPNSAASVPAAVEDGIAVYFSPNGHCTDAIVQEINKAKQSIKVLAYRLTSPQIDASLVSARSRGVAVSVVLDGAQQTQHYSDATFFANQGVPVLIDASHAIAHNKVIVIDDSEIITGIFNFTAAAETSNAENLLVIQNRPALTKAYLNEFQQHVTHSKPYQSPGDAEGGQK